MSELYRITAESSPAPEETALIREGLAAYNREQAGDDGYQPLTLFLRDANDAIVGGLLGATYCGGSLIGILCLAEQVRHQGRGSRLVETAEQMAIARGCHSAHVDTMSFQAPLFYQERGYTIFGVIDDLPRGHRRYYLKKDLAHRLERSNE